MKTYIQTIHAIHLGSFALKYALGALVMVPDDAGPQTYRVISFKATDASPDALGPRVSMTIVLEPSGESVAA